MGRTADSARTTISSDKEWRAISASDLCLWDPLARILTKVDEGNLLLLPICAFLANLLLGFLPGVAVSLVYERSAVGLLPIGHVRELPWALFSELVIAPAIWILYVRQPKWMVQVFRQLRLSGVLATFGDNTALEDFVRRTIVRPLNSWLFLLAAVVSGVITVTIAKLDPYWASYPSLYGYSTVWWLVNPAYHLLWVFLFVFVPGYTAAWMVIRQAVIITSFGELYRAFRLVPKPFYPDKCNGLAPAGAYAIRCTSAAVLYGIWLLGMVTFPILCGEPLQFTYVTIIPLVIYPIAIPALLVPPVWACHVAMGEAKALVLEGVAAQIRGLLSETQYQWIPTSMNLVQRLEEKYELMDRRYRTWPFDVPQLKGFSIAAAIPWLTALGSALMRAYLGTLPD